MTSNAGGGYPRLHPGSFPTSYNKCLMEGSHGSSFGSLQVFWLGDGVYVGVGAPVVVDVVRVKVNVLLPSVKALEDKLE